MQNKTSTIITIVIVVLALIALVWPALRRDNGVVDENGVSTTTTSSTNVTNPRATSTTSAKPGAVVVTPTKPATVTPILAPASNATMTTNVYWGRSGIAECEEVVAVSRTIPKTVSVGRMSLASLLMGPTASEKALGFTTAINPGVTLKNLTITSGVAVANFSSELSKGVAGSCRVQAIRSQITQTLKQFPTVRTVIIAIEGKTIGVLEP